MSLGNHAPIRMLGVVNGSLAHSEIALGALLAIIPGKNFTFTESIRMGL